ncbi:cell division initiation protein [Natranaerovirga pectinivora]|uniref:Cell division initiation protein n=1 Tax=Natranaerovirga pectinivora TaxID=682400 RepID=A0A4V2V0A4_9FIRM|nr:DivIVA domain-containing protein [Natranaerovirga pectinivora]TCT14951.1 cell division initiation protein [Natranaerovirga pectinivora]
MLTPLDIESKTFKKGGMGYSAKEVDKFLREIMNHYEKLYKENIELKDKINVLNEGISYYKTIEETLQSTLLLAERTAEETRANAHNKAQQIEKEAELKATLIVQEAKDELYRVQIKIEELISHYDTYKIQIKQFLKTQLEIIDDKTISMANITSKDEIDSFLEHLSKNNNDNEIKEGQTKENSND